MHPWRRPCGVRQDQWARGSMVRNDRRSRARYDSAAVVRADPTCASTARRSRRVTMSVTSSRRVEASTVAAAITCRSCRSGRNRHRQAAGRGGYGFRESRGPRPRPSSSRRPARKDAPVLRAAVGPPAVARSGDVPDRRARRVRDLPSLTARVRDRCPAPPVSLNFAFGPRGSTVSGRHSSLMNVVISFSASTGTRRFLTTESPTQAGSRSRGPSSGSRAAVQQHLSSR
jgi:hypothetical protein